MPERKVGSFVLVTAVLLCVGLFFSVSGSPPGDQLVKINKPPHPNLSVLTAAPIRVVQELQNCWLARIEPSYGERLSQNGFSWELLDADSSGKSYFLVFLARAEQSEVLKTLGNAMAIEPLISLFWSETENVRGLVPADCRLKKLPTKAVRLQAGATAPAPGGSAASAWITANPQIVDLVSQVALDNLSSDILDLQNFQTRYASTASCEAAGTFLYDFFASLGLAVEYDPFSFSGYTSRNIVATIPGQVAPDQTVIVCGHYDSYSNQRLVLAPGADDNASGTAAAMEIGRLFRGHDFDFTIKLICFSAEEWGLYGSEHYAQMASQQGQKIIAVLNLDMIAYADIIPENLDLIVNLDSTWLADHFTSVSSAYTSLPLLKVVNASLTWSDHSSFWDEGFSALCGIEDWDTTNPYYHQTTDTLDKLNLDFAISVLQGLVATTADLAQPLSTPRTPAGLTARSQINRSLVSATKTAFLSWDSSTEPLAGYHVYRSVTSRSGYQKLTDVPVSASAYTDYYLEPNTSYYYKVKAMDLQNRESNFTQEVRDDENNS